MKTKPKGLREHASASTSERTGETLTMWPRLKLWLLPALGYVVIRGLGATLRLRTIHPERVDTRWHEGKNIIMAFWHGRQLMIPLSYRGPGVKILISAHRDGELIARILRWFGFGTVRGSTTRGGSRALRELVRAGRAGTDLVVTPDGPRGPRRHAQGGVIELAKLTGLPILPITFAASKKNSLGAGIDLRCRCHSVAHVSSGAGRYGFRRTPTKSRSRRSGWNWKSR
ncbi:MAG TPA: lysophospholipid acyltransferase family protein [Nitrospirales bacterium]